MKEKYIPPLIEVFRLEIDASILIESRVGEKIEFDDVQAMGQDVKDVEFDHEW